MPPAAAEPCESCMLVLELLPTERSPTPLLALVPLSGLLPLSFAIPLADVAAAPPGTTPTKYRPSK